MIEKNHFFKVKWELEKFTFSIFSESFLGFLKFGILNFPCVFLPTISDIVYYQFLEFY